MSHLCRSDSWDDLTLTRSDLRFVSGILSRAGCFLVNGAVIAELKRKWQEMRLKRKESNFPLWALKLVYKRFYNSIWRLRDFVSPSASNSSILNLYIIEIHYVLSCLVHMQWILWSLTNKPSDLRKENKVKKDASGKIDGKRTASEDRCRTFLLPCQTQPVFSLCCYPSRDHHEVIGKGVAEALRASGPETSSSEVSSNSTPLDVSRVS